MARQSELGKYDDASQESSHYRNVSCLVSIARAVKVLHEAAMIIPECESGHELCDLAGSGAVANNMAHARGRETTCHFSRQAHPPNPDRRQTWPANSDDTKQESEDDGKKIRQSKSRAQ